MTNAIRNMYEIIEETESRIDRANYNIKDSEKDIIGFETEIARLGIQIESRRENQERNKKKIEFYEQSLEEVRIIVKEYEDKSEIEDFNNSRGIKEVK